MARIGQKGRLTHVRYQRGTRPRGVRQQGFASAPLFGAVCPERDAGVAPVLPESLPRTRSGVSTAAMDVLLAELSRAIPAATHAALVLDRAGWHVSEDLAVPANLTLVPLPPYSPELVWGFACQALTIGVSPRLDHSAACRSGLTGYDDRRGARPGRDHRATTLYPVGPRRGRTMMQPCASAARLRGGGPSLNRGSRAMFRVGLPPPRIVIGGPPRTGGRDPRARGSWSAPGGALRRRA
jgi:hypothetical protein